MSHTRQSVLQRLRPPYTQPTRVVYSFSPTEPTNFGLTLAIATGQPLVAAGDGAIDLVTMLDGKWRNDLDIVRSVAIRIDHGYGVKTWVHGIGQVVAHSGPVTRGALLGYAGQEQVFFGFEIAGKLYDPTHINRYFGIQDGFLAYQKEGKLRQAPDLVTTAVSLIQSLLYQGIRYFVPPEPVPVLFNLDFNGQGTKAGAAVIGEPGDVWQVVPALAFAPVVTYSASFCVGGTLYPADLGFFLNDYRGAATKVYFERGELTAAAGTSVFFDVMLSSWVGGYTGITPLINSFTIRNLPGGVYDLYLYSNGGVTTDTTTFYVSVNGDAPTNKTVTPTLTADWVENENYALFSSLAVSAKGSLTVTVYGYLAGLQLTRP